MTWLRQTAWNKELVSAIIIWVSNHFNELEFIGSQFTSVFITTASVIYAFGHCLHTFLWTLKSVAFSVTVPLSLHLFVLYSSGVMCKRPYPIAKTVWVFDMQWRLSVDWCRMWSASQWYVQLKSWWRRKLRKCSNWSSRTWATARPSQRRTVLHSRSSPKAGVSWNYVMKSTYSSVDRPATTLASMLSQLTD